MIVKCTTQSKKIILMSIFIMFFSIIVYASDNNFYQSVKEVEKLAYDNVNKNELNDAILKIRDLFRSAPNNGVESADALLGLIHLYSFIISEFYRPEFLYKSNILNVDEYPSDKLLMALACLNHPITRVNMDLPVTTWLNELTQGPNLTVKMLAEVVSIYALTSEEGKRIQQKMNSELVKKINNLLIDLFLKQYADSISIQLIFQNILDRGVEKVISEYGTSDAGKLVKTYIETPDRLNLLSEFTSYGISTQILTTHFPAFNKVAHICPSMNFFDINEKVLDKWVEMLKEETDINTRYMLITFLKCGFALNKDCQELVKSALKEMSAREELTSDVLYAKMIMLKYAMKNYWIREAEESLLSISQLGVLPPVHGVKNVYAQQKGLMEKGVEYFVKIGYYDIARKVLEIQSDKYKNSHFEMGVKSKMLKLDKTPVDYSLELINLDMIKSDMRGRPDLIRKYLDEIIKHTPNPELKNLLANHDINQPLKYNIDHTEVVQSSLLDKVREVIELQNAYKAQRQN